ncbi:MAG: RDD family protein [Clostridiales bacterium]|nr:RDD family protein [Clostridiales bacterium]
MFELRKIGIVRRASAALLDVILLVVLTTGFMFILSLICNYSANEKLSYKYHDEWEGFRKAYVAEVAEYYGYDYKTTGNNYTITKDGKKSSLSALMTSLSDSKGQDAATKAAYDASLELTPAEKVNWQSEYVYNLLFMMTSIGLLLAYITLEFVLPIIFKNGQTVGKKVFGICLIRPNCVKINNLSLFARTILGKYAIETMFPVLLVFLFIFGGIGILALILLAALALLNIVLFFATKNRTPIHDLLACTVAADMRVQMIFQTEDELVEKKALAHRELVGQANG